MLHQNDFAFANYPEITDIAVVGTGLGMLQSNLNFVNNSGTFWDTTAWDIFPRPFLDAKSMAYALALSAWIREDDDPLWVRELPGEVKRPMQKSLKFLLKSNDSFFKLSNERQVTLDQPQADWLAFASEESATTQVIAIRHFQPDGKVDAELEALLMEKMKSSNLAIMLQSIDAAERLKMGSDIAEQDPVIEELGVLIEFPNDEVRAKAMCSLTRLAQLNDASINVAVRLLDGNAKHIVFSGIYALGSQDSVPENALPPANRGFVRALQKCDYEFVGLFAAAFNRWMEDPQNHIRTLLEEDSPEYVEIGLEALQQVQDQLVALG